jgi:hypothetical protein
MLTFYLMSLIPVAVGGVLWVMKRKVVWWEWLISTAVSLLAAFIMNYIAVASMTADSETWSGNINGAVYHPRWVEEYQQSHTRTVGSGKNARTETYYTTEHRTHNQFWEAEVNYGMKQEKKKIDQSFYNEIKANWGGEVGKVKGRRPGFDSGDRYDYPLKNKTGYIYPASMSVHFENRIKAAPTVFSYVKVPKETLVFDYPHTNNWRRSNRLLGSAGAVVDILEWDRLNSKLGSWKKVNLIFVGLGPDSQLGHLQEAKWVGGKKNDLVLCYGGDPAKPNWSYVFGWTEKEDVKRNLETLLLGGINNDILKKIESEVANNYVIKDWDKFDYIVVEPPMWAYWVHLLVLILTQTAVLCWAVFNKNTKDGIECRSTFRLGRRYGKIR